MGHSLDQVCLALVPVDALPALAPVRCVRDVRVELLGDRAWVRWNAGDSVVLRCLLPLRGVELFVPGDSAAPIWRRYGTHLPAFDVPARFQDGMPLGALLAPDLFDAERPEGASLEPQWLAVVREDAVAVPREATGVLCCVNELARWADTVPAERLARLRAAQCDSQVLVLGKRLPLLPQGERFWGRQVLIPLGYKVQPELPETVIREALQITDEVLLLRADGAEAIPRSAFEPLGRAAVRLAAAEAGHTVSGQRP